MNDCPWLYCVGEVVQIRVKVVPGASRTFISGILGDALKINIAAVPQKDHANKELIRFLASLLDIAPRRITLSQGTTSPHKTVRIEDIDARRVHTALQSNS